MKRNKIKELNDIILELKKENNRLLRILGKTIKLIKSEFILIRKILKQ